MVIENFDGGAFCHSRWLTGYFISLFSATKITDGEYDLISASMSYMCQEEAVYTQTSQAIVIHIQDNAEIFE